MNRAYLLVFFLLAASFTGCIEEELEEDMVDDTTENKDDEKTDKPEVPMVNFTQPGIDDNSTGVYQMVVVKVSIDVNLTELSYYLKNEAGSTYIFGNGYGKVAMQMIDGKAHGIDMNYGGDEADLKDRITAMEDDDGSKFPVKFFDKDRDGKLTAGDEFLVYGSNGNSKGPAKGGWELEITFDPTGSIISQGTEICCKEEPEVIDPKDDGIASWTFMVYISDSDLEYFSIEDMVEMESVGSNDELNIVVQIDRWDGYDKPDWNDETNGDWETAKRFLLTKGSGQEHIIKSEALVDLGEINTGDPDELIDFVKWAQEKYPAKHYALDIWDHGGGVAGVAYEQSCPEYCYYYGESPDKLELGEIDYALKEITKNGENKLDIVGFDACLMSTIEVVEVVAPYSDIMIGSEILEPGNGWDYRFLQLLADEPSTTPKELGAKIVDTFVAQGQLSSQSFALTMLDMSLAGYALDALNEIPTLRSSTSLVSDLNQIRPNSVHVEPGDSSSAVDLLHMLNSLAKQTSDSKVKTAAETAALRVSDMILKAEFDGDPSDIDTTGMTGISILFPSFESEWATRSKGISESVTEESEWDELMEDFYDFQETEQILFFNASSLIYDTADLDYDGKNDSMTIALDIESVKDDVTANLTLDVFNNRGYWIDGVEYEFNISSDEIVYLDLWDVYYTHEIEDGESDLLRIEGVLSIVNEDGTQILQDWLETPFEYLTYFNESREIILADYLYFTEYQTIEPEIGSDAVMLSVEAKYYEDQEGTRSNREPVMISYWKAENSDFDLNLNVTSITVWWEGTEDNYDAECTWTFVFYINNDQEEYTANCLNDGSDFSGETFIIGEEVTLEVGDVFKVEIWYTGWEDINFYFNSEEIDTGLDVAFSLA